LWWKKKNHAEGTQSKTPASLKKSHPHPRTHPPTHPHTHTHTHTRKNTHTHTHTHKTHTHTRTHTRTHVHTHTKTKQKTYSVTQEMLLEIISCQRFVYLIIIIGLSFSSFHPGRGAYVSAAAVVCILSFSERASCYHYCDGINNYYLRNCSGISPKRSVPQICVELAMFSNCQ
jgi:hypothetical protein